MMVTLSENEMKMPFPSSEASLLGFSSPRGIVAIAPENLWSTGAGNYGWAAQRLSRATALAAVHWQNPRAKGPQQVGR